MKYSGKAQTDNYKLVHAQYFRSMEEIEHLKRSYIWPITTIINGEEQMYDPRAVTIEDGKVKLEMSKVGDIHPDAGNTAGVSAGLPVNQKYYSGLLTSHQSFRIGPFFRCVIRAKLPKGKGLWSAGWLLAIKNKWPDQPMLDEFDIFEALGREESNWYHIASHGYRLKDQPQEENHWSQAVNGKFDIHNEFNDFFVEFRPDGIFAGINDDYMAAFPFPKKYLEHEWHYLLNLAGGGAWAGPLDPEALPAAMYVESVKFYQTTEFGMLSEPIDEASGANNNIAAPPSDSDVVAVVEPETDVPMVDAAGDDLPAVDAIEEKDPTVVRTWGRGYDPAFSHDTQSGLLRWAEHPKATGYKVFRNGAYMATVESAGYTTYRRGFYSVEPVASDGSSILRSRLYRVRRNLAGPVT